MPKVKFAVYYVPEEGSAFYRLGTHLLGYDVRARSSVTLPPDLRARLGPLEATWTASTALAHQYGFHLTTSEALDCTVAAIPQIETELAALLGCFDPAHPFTLRRGETPVGIWGTLGQHSLVLLYEPNEYLRMLHTLIVARVTPLGTGSGFLERYLAHPAQETQAHRAQQTRLFYSPTVLDNWWPHFTVLNPYSGDPAAPAALLTELFARYELLTVSSVCLVVLLDEAAPWQIYQELQRPAPSS
jgi:hypothetical protein